MDPSSGTPSRRRSAALRDSGSPGMRTSSKPGWVAELFSHCEYSSTMARIASAPPSASGSMAVSRKWLRKLPASTPTWEPDRDPPSRSAITARQ